MWGWLWEIAAGVILGVVCCVGLYLIAGLGYMAWVSWFQ